MKIFNVIAILCSLFIVVNGQTEYTFTLTVPYQGESVERVYLHTKDGSSQMNYIEEDGKYTQTVTLQTDGPSDYYYYYSYITTSGNDYFVEIVAGKHPCITNIKLLEADRTVTLRSLQNTNEDTFGAQPPCDVDNVQCDEFVYDYEEFYHFLSPDPFYHCMSIPVDKISTLKDKLAESSSFNGNCEMST